VKKVYYIKKRDGLEEMVKHLEGDMSIVRRLDNNLTFHVRTYEALLSHFA